jgi:arylsulfatase A-like enzyme/Flp pilus assembly protein TadD
VVSVDTLRADRLGLYGARDVPTPHIDALGREAWVFEHAWTVAPLTLPAHASLLTGLWPQGHGVRVNGAHRLPDDVPTLAEDLRSAGFRGAGFVGAFPLERRFGLARGFDLWDDELPRQADGFHYPERRGGEVLARARAWLQAQPADASLFLFVHFYDPHAEYAPPAPFDQRFAARPYDGEVAYVDTLVGELRAALERAGRWGDAVFLLTADHGEALGEEGEATHGMLLHEAGLRVPFVLRAPGLAAQRRSEAVSLVDARPTLLARLGLRPRAPVDGRDVSGPVPAERELYAETLLPLFDHGWSGLRALRRGTFKLVDAPRPRLFDLRADPRARRDLWPAPVGPALLEALRAPRWSSARAPASAGLDPPAREALRSLGYAASAGDVPDDFGRGRPDPHERIAFVGELEAVTALSPRAARRRLDELARREPRSNLVRRRAAAASLADGDPEAAIGHYEAARVLGYAGADIIAALAEAYLRAGQQRAERGDLARAEAHLTEAARLAPARADVLHALGVVLARLVRLEPALRAFEQATRVAPDFAVAWFSAGLALERLGRSEEARAAYRRYLALPGPESPERAHAREYSAVRAP